MDPLDLDDVADALYGASPSSFVADRAAAVKAARAAGDKVTASAIGALRKPTTAAWLVNALVRHRGDDVDRLLDLGEAMREAQAALAGEQLRALTVQRQQVVAAMARQGRALAAELGHPVSEAVAEEVGETLRAALADPSASEAVRSGRLTASLSYAGMGEVDLADVVALAPRRLAREAGRQEARERHDRALREAREQADLASRRADDAQGVADRAALTLDAAQRRQDEARERVRAVEAALREAQEELAAAGEAVAPARKERDAATRAAVGAATAARAALDRVHLLERAASS